MRKTESLLFILLMIILTPIEILCASLAYETIGEVVSRLYIVATVGVNLIFILLSLRSRIAAALGAVVLALLIIPYQVMLADRLVRVQAEAARIVAYAYEYRLETGDYPGDLSSYVFTDFEMGHLFKSTNRIKARAGSDWPTTLEATRPRTRTRWRMVGVTIPIDLDAQSRDADKNTANSMYKSRP
jgi:hypothetical protein